MTRVTVEPRSCHKGRRRNDTFAFSLGRLSAMVTRREQEIWSGCHVHALLRKHRESKKGEILFVQSMKIYIMFLNLLSQVSFANGSLSLFCFSFGQVLKKT